MRIPLVARAAGAIVFAAAMTAVVTARTSPAGTSPAIHIVPIGSYASGQFDEAAAEIVAHDPRTQRLFTVNAQSGQVDVLDVSDPTAPTLLFTIPVQGVANSVAVHRGLVAIAVEASTKTDPGHVAFMSVDGAALATVTVGAQPDMLTFTPDGRRVLVANEGEPSDDYLVDPEGSVSIIDLPRPIASLTQNHVRTARFDLDAADLDPRVRVFGPNATVATNLEPEYITVAKDGRTAWVSLQEANAIAILDVDAGRFTAVRSLGFKDWLLSDGLDASDQSGAIRPANWPVLGMYQPDALASYEHRGRTFIVTVNEGDVREWDGYSELSRFRALSGRVPPCGDSPRLQRFFAKNTLGITTLDQLRDNTNMGRLNVTTATGLRADGSCYEDIYTFGGRSFSIWNDKAELVFDSGSAFEARIAKVNPTNFNSNHTEDNFKGRSDDKGPEPEGVAVAKLYGRVYAFMSLERVGGIMVYDVTDPYAPRFVEYVNNRTFFAPGTTPTLEERGDLGPEGLIVIEPEHSPIRGVPLLVVANEVSGTTTVYRIDRLSGRR